MYKNSAKRRLSIVARAPPPVDADEAMATSSIDVGDVKGDEDDGAEAVGPEANADVPIGEAQDAFLGAGGRRTNPSTSLFFPLAQFLSDAMYQISKF